jgi:ParB-like chromosome segregation protein Spo0J
VESTSSITPEVPNDDKQVSACRVTLDDILLPEDVRQHDEADIAGMADSIRAIGVQTPISVTPEMMLINGLLRYLGARLAGLSSIDCFVIEDSSVQSLWRLSENLHRSPLTALERSTALYQWAEAKAVRLDQVSVGGRGHQGGLAHAARVLGVDRNVLRRSTAIAAIPPETRAEIRKAGLDDNQSALLSIAASPVDQQLAKINEYSARRLSTPPNESELRYQTLMRAWDNCDQPTRARFVDTVVREHIASSAPDISAP